MTINAVWLCNCLRYEIALNSSIQSKYSLISCADAASACSALSLGITTLFASLGPASIAGCLGRFGWKPGLRVGSTITGDTSLKSSATSRKLITLDSNALALDDKDAEADESAVDTIAVVVDDPLCDDALVLMFDTAPLRMRTNGEKRTRAFQLKLDRFES